MLATIQKWGNSNAIRLPKILLDELNISENEQVEISHKDSAIVITKVKPKRKYNSLTELFEGYDGDYKCTEWDTGKPMGKEVW